MNKKSLLADLLTQLRELLKPREYHLSKDKSSLVRLVNAEITHRLVIPIYDYQPEFIISLFFDIRHESTESILNEITDTPQKYRATTATYSTTLEQVVGYETAHFSLFTPTDIQISIKKIIALISKNNILTSMDEISQGIILEKIINNLCQKTNELNYVYYLRGLILASLYAKPELDKLVKVYGVKMQEQPDFAKEYFEKLIRTF